MPAVATILGTVRALEQTHAMLRRHAEPLRAIAERVAEARRHVQPLQAVIERCQKRAAETRRRFVETGRTLFARLRARAAAGWAQLRDALAVPRLRAWIPPPPRPAGSTPRALSPPGRVLRAGPRRPRAQDALPVPIVSGEAVA